MPPCSHDTLIAPLQTKKAGCRATLVFAHPCANARSGPARKEHTGGQPPLNQDHHAHPTQHQSPAGARGGGRAGGARAVMNTPCSIMWSNSSGSYGSPTFSVRRPPGAVSLVVTLMERLSQVYCACARPACGAQRAAQTLLSPAHARPQGARPTPRAGSRIRQRRKRGRRRRPAPRARYAARLVDLALLDELPELRVGHALHEVAAPGRLRDHGLVHLVPLRGVRHGRLAHVPLLALLLRACGNRLLQSG